jgi:D-aspartate ligase
VGTTERVEGTRQEPRGSASPRLWRLPRASSSRPPAVVLGDSDLIRALGLAGIRSAAVAPPGKAFAYSRFVTDRLEWADPWTEPGRLRDSLLAFASRFDQPPPLMFQTDADLAFVSRHRAELGEGFRFVLGDQWLVEQVLDKTQFTELAGCLDLPVPRTAVLEPRPGGTAPDLELDYPLILKPFTRIDSIWRPFAGGSKALRLDSSAELSELWPALAEMGTGFVAQELIPGSEDRIESYHVYVDSDGEVAGEFTGRKVRTLPPAFGQTTALTITDAEDVYELGRHCMLTLGLRGVAKLDFKRTDSGELVLLEVNPRFNLWHLPGAVAGVNLPALVYADLMGLERPPVKRARAGVRWTVPWDDFRSARSGRVPLWRWLAWQVGCETRHLVAIDDPMPIVRGVGRRLLRR